MIVALMPRFHVRHASRSGNSYVVEMDFADGPTSQPHLHTQRYQSLTLAYAMAAAQAQMVLDFIRENQTRTKVPRSRELAVVGSASTGYAVHDPHYPEPLVAGILNERDAYRLLAVLQNTLSEFRRYNAI